MFPSSSCARGRTAVAARGRLPPPTRAGALGARGYGAYAGRYEVDEAAGVVRHHVETAFIPNRVGSDAQEVLLVLEDGP